MPVPGKTKCALPFVQQEFIKEMGLLLFRKKNHKKALFVIDSDM